MVELLYELWQLFGTRDDVGEENEKGLEARDPLFKVELFLEAPNLKMLLADVEVDMAENIAVLGALKMIPFRMFSLSVLSDK